MDADEQGQQTNLGFAIALSLMISMAMQGLFNLRYRLEDPFDRDVRTG